MKAILLFTLLMMALCRDVSEAASSIVQIAVFDPAPSNRGTVDLHIGGVQTYGNILAFPASTTAGNTLLAFIVTSYDGTYHFTNILDSVNGSYTAIDNITDASAANQLMTTQYVPNSLQLKNPSASFSGTIVGSTQILTVTSITGSISVGDLLSGMFVSSQTRIVSQLSGTTGGNGTYQLNIVAGSNIGLESMATANAVAFTVSGLSDYDAMLIMEIAGVTSTPLACHKVNIAQAVTGTTTNSITSGTAACGSSPVMMLGFSVNGTAVNSPPRPVAGTGFASYNGGTGYWVWDLGATDMQFEYANVANPGTKATTFTPVGSDTFDTFMVALTDAGASCAHNFWSSGGAWAQPNGSSGSYWASSGNFATPNCSSGSYWRQDGHWAAN